MQGTTRHAALLLAALLAAHLSLSSAASHGSKVTLKLTDNMKLPSAYAGDTFSGAKTYSLGSNVGEKNAIMDTFVFVVGETKLLQVCRPCAGDESTCLLAMRALAWGCEGGENREKGVRVLGHDSGS